MCRNKKGNRFNFKKYYKRFGGLNKRFYLCMEQIKQTIMRTKTIEQPFWETSINPITGYQVDSIANYNAREQKIINKRAEREAEL